MNYDQTDRREWVSIRESTTQAVDVAEKLNLLKMNVWRVANILPASCSFYTLETALGSSQTDQQSADI